jgi:hypothetical protein
MRVVSVTDPEKPAVQGIEFCGLRRVIVSIVPDPGGDDGRHLPLHCRWTVRRVARDARINEGLGRSGGFDASNQAPIIFESDGGSFLVGPWMGLELIGGAAARAWKVEINDAGELCDAPQWFWLTQTTRGGGVVAPLAPHTSFRAIGGSWETTGGHPIANLAIISTATSVRPVAGTTGVYQTGIEL